MSVKKLLTKSESTVPLGVNLIGYFGKRFGLGESSRLILEALKQAEIPLSLIAVNDGVAHIENEHFSHPIDNVFKYPINLFTVDSAHIPTLFRQNGWDPFKNRYNIGLVFWETTRTTQLHYMGWKYLNELWTTSRFIQEMVSQISSVPTHYFPQPIEINYAKSGSTPTQKIIARADEPFTFLFYFSFSSILGRKNPQAIIHAFQIAFPDQRHVRLIIKSRDGHLFLEQLQSMQDTIKGDSRLTWIDQIMDGQSRFDFMNCCDCYISLHRSEGFGLTLAEAMLLKKPVIATGYSGNLDFMNDENSYLCSYRIVHVGEGNYPYPPEGLWAEPDVHHAAELMRHVVENREEARIKSCKAKDFIQIHHSFQKVGALLAQQLASIQLPIQNPKPWFYFIDKTWDTIKTILRPIKTLLKKCGLKF